MGKNQISNIPTSLCSLTEVTKLYLSDNKLESIPPKIGNMKSMEYLDLSNNSLSGTGAIPSSIGNLRNLNRIDLDGNKLRGDMLPTSLAKVNTNIRLYKNTKRGSDVKSQYFDGSYTRKGYKLDTSHKIKDFFDNNQNYKISIEEGISLQDATNKAMHKLNIDSEASKYVLHRKNYSGSYETIVITAHENV